MEYFIGIQCKHIFLFFRNKLAHFILNPLLVITAMALLQHSNVYFFDNKSISLPLLALISLLLYYLWIDIFSGVIDFFISVNVLCFLFDTLAIL